MSAEISIEQFNAFINSNQSVLAVFYYRPNSPQYRKIKSYLSDALSDCEGELTMLEVDMSIGGNMELSKLYEVKEFPTLIFFKNGKQKKPLVKPEPDFVGTWIMHNLRDAEYKLE